MSTAPMYRKRFHVTAEIAELQEQHSSFPRGLYCRCGPFAPPRKRHEIPHESSLRWGPRQRSWWNLYLRFSTWAPVVYDVFNVEGFPLSDVPSSFEAHPHCLTEYERFTTTDKCPGGMELPPFAETKHWESTRVSAIVVNETHPNQLLRLRLSERSSCRR